ncbi:MAG: carbamoyltransferase HypF, partial [Cyanobacteria bacterium P01_G01_bin.49]
MSNLQRLKITIRGAVQGVGFRPFIYRLATELKLNGWVNNSASGVFIEVEGNKNILDTFVTRISQEKPPRSQIQTIETSWSTPIQYTSFEIRRSIDGDKTAIILPDLATCSDCLQEIFDKNNRRYYYPFTNCTNCGPRYTIMESLPYDRPGTTMKDFIMCELCQEEYNNPLDRRFHAQPNACPNCGPKLELWDQKGTILGVGNEAFKQTVNLLKNSQILAIKGLGGFHLMVDARNPQAVEKLRRRKCRPDKPFALMYPSLNQVKLDCEVSELEEKLLTSAESPIVLLKRQKTSNNLAHNIAPNNPYLGVMLPYTPLHHLLLREINFPLVATSGNLANEPICIDEQEALIRLGKIADLFLVHNRPIIRPVDDSVVRIMGGREMVIRRARGYAPFPIQINRNSVTSNILAVGGHLKNTVAILKDNQVFISQHIGDLSTKEALNSFDQVIKNLKELYDFEPEIIVCDAHPDYLSSQFAAAQNLPLIKVQHHYAHVLACVVENQLKLPILGVAWDGTGYGNDGTIWGGEFLAVTDKGYERIANFRSFKLPGGQQAIKDPKRIALGILFEIFGTFNHLNLPFLETFSKPELNLIEIMLVRHLNSPSTSSVGRLFDGVAAIIGLCQKISFEGQGGMSLEQAIDNLNTQEFYPYEVKGKNLPLIVDWELMIKAILEDVLSNISG